MHMLAGDYDAALAALPPIIAGLDRIDAISNAAAVRGWLALAEARTGDLAAARETAVAALAGSTYGSAYETRTHTNIVLTEVHIGAGDAAAALAAARAASAIAETGDWALLRAEARLGLARALEAAGDISAAAAAAQRALDLSRAKGHAGGIAAADAVLGSLVVAPG
jgi:tetratricopeptide (TPR) repeat protein